MTYQGIKTFTAMVGVVITLGLPTQVSAATILSNLSDANVSWTVVNADPFAASKDAGWTMGANDMTLDSIQLDLFSVTTAIPLVSIWSGAAGAGTLLGNLVNPTFSTAGTFAFTTSSTIALLAGQNYWLRVQAGSGTGAFAWRSTNVNPTGTDATSLGYVFNGNPSTFRNKFAVNATLVPPPPLPSAVPLPAGLGLLLAGLGALGLARRRPTQA